MPARLVTAASCLLLAASPMAMAVGLGEIQLHSSLNAPLDAEIEVLEATADELATLRPQLAPRETFTRNGLEYPAFLANVTLRAVQANGRNVIQVRSNEPITEPFATILVQVTMPRGVLVR